MPTINLAAVSDINTVINAVNAQGYDIQPEQFYDQQLLDAIKLGNEHYVHLRYAQPRTLPVGHKQLQMRRWGGLTAHTVPLIEGIPPQSDRISMESLTVSPTMFGRYIEFTDRVNMDQIDPIIAHYTRELGDVAVRTLERYCREEMLSSANKWYGGLRANAGELILGDMITFDTLRYIVLRMQRLMVKPLQGYFHVICSPEFKYDLLDDELVREFMKLEQTGKYYLDGEIPPLFGIKLVETMLDEFYTLELDNPAEFINDDGDPMLRAYYIDGTGVEYYVNIPEAYREVQNHVYLSDGSAIPERVRWNIAKFFTDKLAATDKTITVTKVERGANTDGTDKITAEFVYTVTEADIAAGITPWTQLPVHKAILLGDESTIKIGLNGEGNAKTFVQGLGSAGTNDPIHQRQSVGFKINSFGIATLRDEASAVIFTVPSKAIYTKDLMAEVMVGNHDATKTATKSYGGTTYTY